MFRVILVDNEKAIRKGIVDSVDWVKLGIEVAGEASDGQAALKMIDELNPDILITDIKMPFMDGLKLAELALEVHPELRVIFVSGYDDFKYAQKGIQLGVSGYVLKPVDKEEIELLLGKLVNTLSEDRPQKKAKEVVSGVRIDHLLLEKFFRGIIYGKRKKEEAEALQNELMGPDDLHFACAIIQLDNQLAIIQDMTEEEQQAFYKEFFETIESYLVDIKDLVGVVAEEGTYNVFIYDVDIETVKERMARMASQLKQIMLNIDMSVTIGIGNIYKTAYGLKNSYKEAREALKYKYVTGMNNTIYYSNLSGLTNSCDVLQINMVDGVLDSIEHNNKVKLKELLDKACVEFLTGGHQSQDYTNLFISETFKKTLNYLDGIGISVEEIFEDTIGEYSAIIKAPTLKMAMGKLNDLLCKVIDYISIKKQGRFSSYIEQAKKYIEENYTDSDINLTKIAGRIQMSVSYFSYEFKQEVGKTYIEFLTELRLNRAKQLLKNTSLKVSDISNMVGYENSTYFNYLFKQNTGVTPGQFRKDGLA